MFGFPSSSPAKKLGSVSDLLDWMGLGQWRCRVTMTTQWRIGCIALWTSHGVTEGWSLKRLEE